MVEALLLELELQREYLAGASLQSIYLGGGTPSLLTERELSALFEKIYALYAVTDTAEITLEANPDDLTAAKVAELKRSPVNRLSIGVQSFFDEDLRFMNRAHDAREARACIRLAQDAGFDNLTVDLIYGSPTTPDEHWRHNVQTLVELQVPHLSCYALTVEPRTALAHFVASGKAAPVDEEQAARQFEWLMDAMAAAGYEHYEISNFAKPGWEAVHNGNYWRGQAYLGLGPSAHSFDGESRQWNVAHNHRYLQSIAEGRVPFEREVLTPDDRYNEYVMTALRTSWGVDLRRLQTMGEPYVHHFLTEASIFLERGHLLHLDQTFRLTRSGKLLADRIAAELFF